MDAMETTDPQRPIVDDPRLSGPTCPLPIAADLLGVGHSTAYKSAAAGTFPTRIIRVGSRIVVPTADLIRLLGLPE